MPVNVDPYVNYYSDPQTGQTIRMAWWGEPKYSPQCYHSVIAFRSDNAPWVPSAHPRGQLNLAPTGLGLLAFAGYMPDLRSFYCPTGSQFDWSLNRKSCDNGSTDTTSFIINTDVGNLKKLGGVSGWDLTHGDLTWVEDYPAAGNGGGKTFYPGGAGLEGTVAIGCSYTYRNQVAIIGGADSPDYTHVMNAFNVSGQTLPFMTSNCTRADLNKPNMPTGAYPPPYPAFMMALNLCPDRKTQKVLCQYPVIADRFQKAGLQDAYGRVTYPGDGLYGHQEGYNILYGDGSVRWYSDPKQNAIWTQMPIYDGWQATCAGNSFLGVSGPTGTRYGNGIGYFRGFGQNSTFKNWNTIGWGFK
jgi:prepilin-type processing-associated H-X9-DG protein